MAGRKRKAARPKTTGHGESVRVACRPESGVAVSSPSDSASVPRQREAVTELFTRQEVSKLLGVSPGRLSTLDKNGIASPTGRRHGKRAYTFVDLIALRTAKALLDRKVRLRDVTRSVSSLRKHLPKARQPLSELRVLSDGKQVFVQAEAGRYEPASGQFLLEFEVKTLRDDVVRVLRPAAGANRARDAYELYLQASQLDEHPETMGTAESLYRRAIELDPWLAIAYTNLGNIRFRQQDTDAAEALYRKALELDAAQPEAQYNLGYVILERGEPEPAIRLFRGAIDADPKFSDAYFNLAMAYEQVGQGEQARPFWESYVQLEPRGTWSDIARRHL